MTGVQTWQVDRLYDAIRTSSAYHNLPRKQFDLILEMLAGRYADQHVRELKARVSWDRLENTVRARQGALHLVYRSGGTIPDRGYFDLRLRHTAAKIGELDEEFVWERKVGDTFNLGTQNWKIVRIDSKNVEVIPWTGPVSITPFWRAEKAGREFAFGDKVGTFLEAWNDRLDRNTDMLDELVSEYFLSEISAEALISFLRRQKAAAGGELPHRHHLLIEHVEGPLARASLSRVILHTLWGSRVNHPFSLILEAAWQKSHPRESIEVLADDDCLLIVPSDPERFSIDELFALVEANAVEDLLKDSLEASGFFGARFRENAGRALILPRSNPDRRIPLWLTRMRARKLLERVSGYAEFPILLETWRSCLQDEFDLPSLKLVLSELFRGQIRRSDVWTQVPSPFADNISWIQTNQHMYQGDGLSAAGSSAIQGDVFAEILHCSRLRPRIDPELVGQLQSKLQRTAPGYAPAPEAELLDWLKERLLVEDSEWGELMEAVRRDHDLKEDPAEKLTDRMIRYRLPGADRWVVSALERMPRILSAFGSAIDRSVEELIDLLAVDRQRFYGDSLFPILDSLRPAVPEEEGAGPALSALLAEWLRFYGPVALQRLRGCFGLTSLQLASGLEVLAENRSVVVDKLTRDATELQVCDTENLEILLRQTRTGAQPAFQAVNLDQLPLFLALQQGLVGRKREQRKSTPEDLRRILESLFGFPARVRRWEEELFPARLAPYYGSWLDELLRSSELQWVGCGRQRITFCFSSDLELFFESETAGKSEELQRLLPFSRGKYSFWDLVDHSGFTPGDAARRIWDLVWKGRLAADSFEVVRKSAQPLSGSWYGIDVEGEADALEEEELARDRVRQLLRRYGILFRELLARELPALQWPRVFRTMRVMELSGEILSGHFFAGIPGLQFISHRGFHSLNRGLPEGEIYWICAADPASPCGPVIDFRFAAAAG
jgi:ATP-dependent Lhr-like helicase